MLVIQMPDGHDKKKNRHRWRALGYAISGLIIMACLFLAITSLWVFFIVVTVETWWVWATLTDPGLER